MSPAAVEADVGALVADDQTVNRRGCREIEREPAAGVPLEVAVRVGLNKEVDVGAVSVTPAGHEGGFSPQAKVLLTAEGAPEGNADRIEELARSSRQPEISHAGGRGAARGNSGTWLAV